MTKDSDEVIVIIITKGRSKKNVYFGTSVPNMGVQWSRRGGGGGGGHFPPSGTSSGDCTQVAVVPADGR